ncbi:hypothetical protein, partial [Streptomyces sp. NPDC056304]|uniref:hypothetical protein n=1 Tax=Streptomyces sp. NPDC056304 TaxID=3345778 RepID=UPI0035D5D310
MPEQHRNRAADRGTAAGQGAGTVAVPRFDHPRAETTAETGEEGEELGGFNRSSQHLDREVKRWVSWSTRSGCVRIAG